jgi:hypothetical protein
MLCITSIGEANLLLDVDDVNVGGSAMNRSVYPAAYQAWGEGTEDLPEVRPRTVDGCCRARIVRGMSRFKN